MEGEDAERVERLLEILGLADALESERFKQFLDHVPVAIVVSELLPSELITYANLEFERLTGHAVASVEGKSWKALPGVAAADHDDRILGEAVEADEEYIGTSGSNEMLARPMSTLGPTRSRTTKARRYSASSRWPASISICATRTA